MACSALKRRYRDLLRTGSGQHLAFIHLDGDPTTISQRVSAREHFMPRSLLHSQLETLEPLQPDEVGVRIDLDQSPGSELNEALGWLTPLLP
jgi:gluconokinase